MRLCRFEVDGKARLGFYTEDRVADLEALSRAAGETRAFPESLLAFLPPEREGMERARRLADVWQESAGEETSGPPVTCSGDI